MDNSSNSIKYQKLLIDNATCHRRFHLVFESGAKTKPQVQVSCPHCGVLLFEKSNHPVVTLVREENLIKSPDGRELMVYDCHWNTPFSGK